MMPPEQIEKPLRPTGNDSAISRSSGGLNALHGRSAVSLSVASLTMASTSSDRMASRLAFRPASSRMIASASSVSPRSRKCLFF